MMLTDAIREAFADAPWPRLSLKYRDEDGAFIIIVTEAELVDAIPTESDVSRVQLVPRALSNTGAQQFVAQVSTNGRQYVVAGLQPKRQCMPDGQVGISPDGESAARYFSVEEIVGRGSMAPFRAKRTGRGSVEGREGIAGRGHSDGLSGGGKEDGVS